MGEGSTQAVYSSNSFFIPAMAPDRPFSELLFPSPTDQPTNQPTNISDTTTHNTPHGALPNEWIWSILSTTTSFCLMPRSQFAQERILLVKQAGNAERKYTFDRVGRMVASVLWYASKRITKKHSSVILSVLQWTSPRHAFWLHSCCAGDTLLLPSLLACFLACLFACMDSFPTAAERRITF